MGLIKEGEKYSILTDIMGMEDHLGDMDFKVAGTANGVTALQMDIKIGGVTRDIMQKALSQARDGRLHILGKMAETLAEPRPEMSPFAPRITTIWVKTDKIRALNTSQMPQHAHLLNATTSLGNQPAPASNTVLAADGAG